MDDEIDHPVYELYEISDVEIAIVEGNQLSADADGC